MKQGIPLLWVLKKMHRRIPALLLLIAASAGTAVFGVVFALGTRNVIDAAIGSTKDAFLRACFQQGGIILGILLCTFLSRNLTDRLNADLDRDWKRTILHDLLRGDYAAVSRYHSGELIHRLNHDVRIVNEGLVMALPNVVAMIARMVSAFAVLTSLEPWFALVICAFGALVVIATGFMRRRLKTLHKIVSEKEGKVSAFLQETLENLLIVQAMDLSGEMERRADGLLDQRYQMQRKRKNVTLFANTSISIMSYGSGFVALVWCASRLLAGTMTFGSLTAITNLVNQLQSPFVSLSAVIPKYIAMVASSERLMELENIPADMDAASIDSQAVYEKMAAISAKDLTFSYDRDQVLRDANFVLPKGSFTAITGPSGTGKSTILKLLLGIYRPEQGSISLSCGDEQISLDRSTRRMFAYVPQGNLLLSGTLRENLLIAKPDATEEEVSQAVYVSAIDAYLPQLPLGLETVLGEGGAGLSEGQAQRVAIARAILGGAPILLLDECTSALDQETEKMVLQRIRTLPNRTCIAVTHRPAALELCDLKLEIQDNQINTIIIP